MFSRQEALLSFEVRGGFMTGYFSMLLVFSWFSSQQVLVFGRKNVIVVFLLLGMTVWIGYFG